MKGVCYLEFKGMLENLWILFAECCQLLSRIQAYTFGVEVFFRTHTGGRTVSSPFALKLMNGRRLLHFDSRKKQTQLPHPIIFRGAASQEAEATSAQSLTSSSSRPLWKYDVFLSFRGTGVRKGFLSHLYKSLTDNGIHTFRDDTELQRGNFISPALLEAIQQSRFAVVVLSENYGTSRWCLQELAHITRCVDDGEHDQKRLDTDTVESWRIAMAQVGLISGWDSRNWNEEVEAYRGACSRSLRQIILTGVIH